MGSFKVFMVLLVLVVLLLGILSWSGQYPPPTGDFERPLEMIESSHFDFERDCGPSTIKDGPYDWDRLMANTDMLKTCIGNGLRGRVIRVGGTQQKRTEDDDELFNWLKSLENYVVS